jgi:hypothetical protein
MAEAPGRRRARPRHRRPAFRAGAPPRSIPRMWLSPHGYLGIEARVVDGIAAWIKAQ